MTVSADATVLETATSSIGKVVDNRRIMELPLNSRNVYSLIYLTPGVTSGIGNNYNSLSYSVNGARFSLMDTLIDGVPASHPTGPPMLRESQTGSSAADSSTASPCSRPGPP